MDGRVKPGHDEGRIRRADENQGLIAFANLATAGRIIWRGYPLNPITSAERGGASTHNLLIARTMTPRSRAARSRNCTNCTASFRNQVTRSLVWHRFFW
jgi:hypothetical protein